MGPGGGAILATVLPAMHGLQCDGIAARGRKGLSITPLPQCSEAQ